MTEVSSIQYVATFCPAERQHASSSRAVSSQLDSRTPLSMHSSQQLPHHQHRSSSGHHHQHSGPHSQQRRERGNRLDPEDARGYISQPPLAQHRSPSHNAMHSSPKRSTRYPPHTQGEPFQPSSHLYQKRRRSNEESPDQRTFADPNSEKRRVSAESAVAHDPRRYRSNHPQSFKHEQSKARPAANAIATSSFVETSTSGEYLEASSSQQWEDSVNADIIITPEGEEGTKSWSASSGSTVIESDSPPRETKKMGNKQDLSQEPFGDDDCKDLMSLSELAPGPIPIPLSNFPHYYESPSYFGDQQQEMYHQQELSLQASFSSSKLEQGLSPPSHSSPPKSRYGKSLTDLTGSNISLTSSQQFLSQSAIDIQHMHDLQRYSDSSRQGRESRRKHGQRYQAPRHGQLQRMSSDSHLNKSHIPGLQVAITSALSNVSEEQEHRRQQKKALSRTASQQAHRVIQQHTPPTRNSQLQQRHLKATMVVRGREEGNKQSTSPHKNR